MIIATHNGPFHADDVFAIAILKKVYSDAEIIRTRNPELLKKADMRVDVGGLYNSLTGDFDHHQGKIPSRDNQIPYAACGLVWKHFGKQIVNDELIDILDRHVFQAIDASDNGIEFPKINDELRPYTISLIIDVFNQQWNEGEGEHFHRAVTLATEILDREIHASVGLLEAKDFVRATLKKYEKEQYLVLDEFRPWKSVVVKESDKLFCLHPRGDGSWNAFAVPKEMGGFENRLDFPTEWAGLGQEELSRVSGVKDAVFCHKNLFICVAKSFEGALQLVEKALSQPTRI